VQNKQIKIISNKTLNRDPSLARPAKQAFFSDHPSRIIDTPQTFGSSGCRVLPTGTRSDQQNKGQPTRQPERMRKPLFCRPNREYFFFSIEQL
jgi:hypothetical protein